MTDYSLRIRCNKEQVATVMVTTARVVADAQIDPSYSPGGASCILIGSSVFAGFTVIIEKSGPSHSLFRPQTHSVYYIRFLVKRVIVVLAVFFKISFNLPFGERRH